MKLSLNKQIDNYWEWLESLPDSQVPLDKRQGLKRHKELKRKNLEWDASHRAWLAKYYPELTD